jgi:hypothetical protein
MKRKDSILANFYYQSLPKAKEGGNYFNKYKVPQNNTPEYRNDPILKFFNDGGSNDSSDKKYETLPNLTIFSKTKKKSKEPEDTSRELDSQTIIKKMAEVPKNLLPKRFIPPVESSSFKNRKVAINPFEQASALAGFIEGMPQFDVTPSQARTTVPYTSYSQSIDTPLINTGRKGNTSFLNNQLSELMARQAMMNLNSLNEQEAYISMLEQTDPEKAYLLKMMNPNAFKQKFFNGGFLMPAQEGGNINFPNQRGYTPKRMGYGGWIGKYDKGGKTGDPNKPYDAKTNPEGYFILPNGRKVYGKTKEQKEEEQKQVTAIKKYAATIPKTSSPEGYLSIKNNQDWFDSHADWTNTGDTKINNQDWDDYVRKQVLTGRFGIEPSTGALVKLPQNEWTNVSDEYKRLATDKRQWTPEQKQTSWEKQVTPYIVQGTKKLITNPVMMAPGAILTGGMLSGIPAIAETAAAVAPALTAPLVSSIPASSLSNLAGAYFASDALVNRLPQVPGQIGKGDYTGAAENIITGGLDLLGANMVSPIYKGASNLLSEGKNLYNTVATGESVLPIAWKSPAVGLSQDASANMFKGLLNSNKLTDAERALVVRYQQNSRPFTGRGSAGTGFIDEEKRNALNNIIKKYNLNVGDNAILTRKFNPNDASLPENSFIQTGDFNYGERPTSFSAGLGSEHYGNTYAKDRVVIPNRYAKKMGSNFLANEYGALSDDALNMISDPSIKDFASKIGNSNEFINTEREVIGTGLNFKRIGKVKNDIGGYDWVVKPKSNSKFGSLSLNNQGTIEAASASEGQSSFKQGLKRLDEFGEQVIGTFKPGRKKAIAEGNQWMDQWVQDPATQAKIDDAIADLTSEYQRITNQIPSHNTQVHQSWKAHYDRLMNSLNYAKNYKGNSKEYPLLHQTIDLIKGRPGVHRGNWGISYGHGMYPWMDYNGQTYKQFIKENPRYSSAWISRTPMLGNTKRASTTVHENTHEWIKSDLMAQALLREEALNSLNPNSRALFDQWESLHTSGKSDDEIAQIMGGHQNRYIGYLGDPTEIHARIMELRKHYNMNPSQIVDPKKAAQIIDDVKTGKTPVDSRFAGIFENEGTFANAFNKLWAVPGAVGAGYLMTNESNAQSNKQKYGGTWLSKYPTGGSTSIAAPAPTTQTGSPTQYGPTFSNQAGYMPPENKREKREKFMLDALKLGVFMGGILSGDDNKSKNDKKNPQEKKDSENISNKPIGVDGNGNPLPGIAWNYNSNIETQKPKDPTAAPFYGPEGGVSAANPANGWAKYGGGLSNSTGWLGKYDDGGFATTDTTTIAPFAISPMHRKGWEAYREYLDKQGLYGDERLNHAFGKTTFNKWTTKNPQYGLNWDILPYIGEDIQKQKQQLLQREKKGNFEFFEDNKKLPVSKLNPTIETNLKSKNVWWPGTEFTSQGYTDFEEQLVDNKGNVLEKVKHGVINPDTSLEFDEKNFKKLNQKKGGGDVSIYGRRNYKADTPTFFAFGGLTNGMNLNNNWLKKYKS